MIFFIHYLDVGTLVKARSDQDRSGQVRSDYVRIGQVRSVQVI